MLTAINYAVMVTRQIACVWEEAENQCVDRLTIKPQTFYGLMKMKHNMFYTVGSYSNRILTQNTLIEESINKQLSYIHFITRFKHKQRTLLYNSA